MWTTAGRRLARASIERANPASAVPRRAFAATDARVGSSEILSTPRPSAERPSVDADEALDRGRRFYRDCCREIPWVMENYALEEVTTTREIRAALKAMIRERGEEIKQRLPMSEWAGALDQALMRGREELIALEAHHYNRHHLITNFVNARCVETTGKERATTTTKSAFVKDFLSNGRREMH